MGTEQRGGWVKNEALNAFSSLRFHLEENGAKYFQLSSLMRFQKYLFSVSSDDVSVFHFDAFSPPGGGVLPYMGYMHGYVPL